METESTPRTSKSPTGGARSIAGVTPLLVDVVLFELAGQRYGLLARQVVEVVPAVVPVPLPGAPAVVLGVVNLRGSPVPVFDLRARFGRPPKAIELDDHLIIAAAGDRPVVLPTDRVVGLITLDPDQLEAVPSLAADNPYVVGVGKMADGLVLIHDLEAFLSPPEAEQLERALTPARSEDGA